MGSYDTQAPPVPSRIVEGGGIVLAVATISDKDVLVREGATIDGVNPGSAGDVLRTADGTTWTSGAPTLTETSGPTVLSMGSCPDSGILLRSGSTIVGVAPSVAGSILQWSGSTWVDSSRASAIATTSTPGLVLANTTAATSGVPVQYSTALQLSGTAHDTDGNVSVAHHCRVGLRPVNGNTTTSAIHFSFATDSGGYTSRANIDNSGNFTSTNLLGTAQVEAGATGSRSTINSENVSTGLGTIYNWRVGAGNANQAFSLVHKSRTDAANAVVFQTCYYPGAASVTNAATMRLHSFAWTSLTAGPTYTNTEVASVRVDGSVYGVSLRATGDLGGVASTVTFTNTVEATAGAATGNYLVFYNGTTRLKLAILADS